MREIEQVKRELDVVKFETDMIKHDVEKVKDKLIDHTPEHFSKQDFIRSGIGATFFGFSVLFSGNLINLVTALPTAHLYIIILVTLFILTLEIYAIGYRGVSDKVSRGFGQFWFKRIITFYATALIISTVLALTFGLQYLVGNGDKFISLIIVVSAPCAIGASLDDLLKKY